MLDTDLSWTTDLRWSTGPSWTTFSTIFGLFPSGPRSVPGRFFINGKVLPQGSGGVLSDFFFDFFRRCSGRSPDHFPGLPEGFWGLLKELVWGPRGPMGPPMGPWGPIGPP